MKKCEILAVSAAVLLSAGCSKTSADPMSHAHDAAAPASAANVPKPHGGHDPAYGGTVTMTADMHFETVLDQGGKHRIYWSDAARTPLAASTLAAVSMRIERGSSEPEQLELKQDPSGSYWVAQGKPLADPAQAKVTVTFNRPGEPPATMPIQSAPAAPGGSADKHGDHQHEHDKPSAP